MGNLTEQPQTTKPELVTQQSTVSQAEHGALASAPLNINAPLNPQKMLQMQKTYGNRFVLQRLLQRQPDAIQRQERPPLIATEFLTPEEQREREAASRAEAQAEFPEALQHLQELLQAGNTTEATTYLRSLNPYIYPHLAGARAEFAHTTYPDINHHELFRIRGIIQFGWLIPTSTIERFIELVQNQEIQAISRMLNNGLGEDDSPAENLRQGFLDVPHYLEFGLPTSAEHVQIIMNPDTTGRDLLTRDQNLAEERAALLALLQNRDAAGFTARLRHISDTIAEALDQDADFVAQLNQSLHGMGRFTARMLLRFGQSLPHSIQQFQLAVHQQNVQLIKDLLRAYPELGTDAAGARELLIDEFSPSPDLNEMVRLLEEQVQDSGIYEDRHSGVHYDTPHGTTTGPVELRRHGGSEEFTISRTANELRVILHIHFVYEDDTDRTFYPPPALASEWRSEIEDVWNNRFEAFNGSTLLNLVFVPIFNDLEHGADQTVRISAESTATLRENEGRWAEDTTGRTAAHEFGHMLGNRDEYNLPQSRAEITAAGIELDEEDLAHTTVEDIVGDDASAIEERDERGTDLLGIMGSPHGEDYAPRPRHVQHLVEWYNQNLKPTAEADYHVTNLSR